MLKGRPSRPLILFFIVLNAFVIIFRRNLMAFGFNVDILILGNILLFAITLLSFFLLKSGLKASTTPGFLRSVYGSFLVKLVVAGLSAWAYAYFNRENINKPSLFTLMALYLVYTFIEMRTLLRIGRK